MDVILNINVSIEIESEGKERNKREWILLKWKLCINWKEKVDQVKEVSTEAEQRNLRDAYVEDYEKAK